MFLIYIYICNCTYRHVFTIYCMYINTYSCVLMLLICRMALQNLHRDRDTVAVVVQRLKRLAPVTVRPLFAEGPTDRRTDLSRAEGDLTG